MNKVFKYSFIVLAVSLTIASCKKEGVGPAATNIDGATIASASGEGTVTLSWNIPDGANYQYVRVQYNHPGTGKTHTRLASVYSNSITIDGLKKRYGAIEFSLTPVTKKGAEGTTHKISATSDALPLTVAYKEKSKITFSATNLDATKKYTSDVWLSTSQAQNDGDGAAALVDGNAATYWHGNWSSVRQNPNYIVIDLKESVYAMDFKMLGRQGTTPVNKDAPKQYDIYGVNTFDGTAFLADPSGIETKNDAKLIMRVMDVLPAQADRVAGVIYRQSTNATGTGATNLVAAESPFIFSPLGTEKYRYIIFKINTTQTNTHFPTLAELEVYKAKYNLYDPEAETTTEIQ